MVYVCGSAFRSDFFVYEGFGCRKEFFFYFVIYCDGGGVFKGFLGLVLVLVRGKRSLRLNRVLEVEIGRGLCFLGSFSFVILGF